MTDPSGNARGTPSTQPLELERRILRARAAAMDALDQGNWDAVVLSCGKVLQEVARTELPYNEHGGTLPQLLERLSRKLQTDQPVSDLASALKDAGGLRGFFDLETDVDEELARATVSVIEAFLTYTYAFREEVRRLADLAAARRERASGTPQAEALDQAAGPAATTTVAQAPQPSRAPTNGGGGPERDIDRAAPQRPAADADRRGRDVRSDEAERAPSAFDRFEDRKDDPIRQTWKPPRSKE